MIQVKIWCTSLIHSGPSKDGLPTAVVTGYQTYQIIYGEIQENSNNKQNKKNNLQEKKVEMNLFIDILVYRRILTIAGKKSTSTVIPKNNKSHHQMG